MAPPRTRLKSAGASSSGTSSSPSTTGSAKSSSSSLSSNMSTGNTASLRGNASDRAAQVKFRAESRKLALAGKYKDAPASMPTAAQERGAYKEKIRSITHAKKSRAKGDE